MKCSAAFIYSDEYTQYHFHTHHPFNQKRVRLTVDLLKEANALTDEQIIKPRLATDEELAMIHDKAYIKAVKAAEKGELSEEKAVEFGLGTEDTPIFKGMHRAAALMAGGSLSAVDAVLEGNSEHALNLGGGLHHGFQRKASGFCIYNDAAITIQYIRKHYNLKVLYVDTDAHHGDGVQWAFYDDPNVCTFSIHETGRYLFPGTGNVNERGVREGYGSSYNIPLDAFTEDDSFLEIYETAMKEITEHFRPDIIVTQNGADAHAFDPLTHLCGTMHIYESIPALAHELAHKYCNGKWIALGGGGYDIWRVVPRAWAQIWNIMSINQTSRGSLPAKWLDKVQQEAPVPLPQKWQDNNDIYQPIPRKNDISEKNHQTLKKALQFIENQKKFKNGLFQTKKNSMTCFSSH